MQQAAGSRPACSRHGLFSSSFLDIFCMNCSLFLTSRLLDVFLFGQFLLAFLGAIDLYAAGGGP